MKFVRKVPYQLGNGLINKHQLKRFTVVVVLVFIFIFYGS